MANGASQRWTASSNKHELVVDGEPILSRIVRLTAGHDVVIAGPYPGLGVPNMIPDSDLGIVDGRLSVRSLWATRGRTLILLGDTYYSDAAMTRILDHPGPEPCLFARFHASQITGKPWPEPFANSFMVEHQAGHERSLRYVQALKDKGKLKRAGLWEAYKLEHGKLLPFRYQQRNYGNAVEIDDWTEDFDSPADYDEFMKRRTAVAA